MSMRRGDLAKLRKVGQVARANRSPMEPNPRVRNKGTGAGTSCEPSGKKGRS